MDPEAEAQRVAARHLGDLDCGRQCFAREDLGAREGILAVDEEARPVGDYLGLDDGVAQAFGVRFGAGDGHFGHRLRLGVLFLLVREGRAGTGQRLLRRCQVELILVVVQPPGRVGGYLGVDTRQAYGGLGLDDRGFRIQDGQHRLGKSPFGLQAPLLQVRLRRLALGDQVAGVEPYHEVAGRDRAAFGRQPCHLALPHAGQTRHLDDLRVGVVDNAGEIRRRAEDRIGGKRRHERGEPAEGLPPRVPWGGIVSAAVHRGPPGRRACE